MLLLYQSTNITCIHSNRTRCLKFGSVAICCVQGEPKMVSNDKWALCVWDEPHLFDFVYGVKQNDSTFYVL
jgi:hypothetical protein